VSYLAMDFNYRACLGELGAVEGLSTVLNYATARDVGVSAGPPLVS
jgi:hypothetical protein